MSNKQYNKIENAQRAIHGTLLCIPARASKRNDDGTPRTKQQIRMAQRIITWVMEASL